MVTSHITVIGELARSYAEQFPEANTRSLANMLVRDHKKVFCTYEQARSAVRYYRGEAGKTHRKECAKIVEHEKRYGIPESDAEPVLPIKFDLTGAGIVMSDLHVPYHDVRAIETMLAHAEKHKFTDYAVIDGDFLDCYQLSRFVKDPRKRCFAAELEAGKQMLDVFGRVFKKLWYKLGNHEIRYEHYLYSKAAELLGVPEFQLERLLDLAGRKVQYVAHNRVIEAGKLNILHGHEYPGGAIAPVNPARGMFMRASACTISGHQHQTSQHHQPDIRGTLISCWSLGCLCELHPEYAVLNKWNHGFGEMTFDGKWFEVNTKRIIDGRVV